VDTSGHPSVFISYYNGHGITSVRPLSTVDNTRDYARVSHSRQWLTYYCWSPTALMTAGRQLLQAVQQEWLNRITGASSITVRMIENTVINYPTTVLLIIGNT